MATTSTNEVHPGFIGLLVAAIIFLVGIFASLFAPSAPTATVRATAIPLENASSLTSSSQLQGTSQANPQNAAKMQPGDLQNTNF